ncbi:MAG: hypothetical protein QOI47_2563 [Actinomycetota bacterium]|nr:hypothetical protein [Actinomycetota bacterium]
MTDEAGRALEAAEEQIETWLCELDATWTRLLADARIGAVRIVATAQADANAALAIARADSASLVSLGHTHAALIVSEAEARAREIVHRAETESRSLLAGAAKLASMQLADAEAEVQRARSLAVESSATAEAIASAADATVSGRVRVDDLAALGHAVERLRTELSRVVDAAFDALPAVEATAAALKLDDVAPVPVAVAAPPKKRGFVKRLLRV